MKVSALSLWGRDCATYSIYCGACSPMTTSLIHTTDYPWVR